MNHPRISAAAWAIALVALAGLSGRCAARSVLASAADCAAGERVVVSWAFSGDPSDPPAPEWIGYDVLRRPAAACGPFARLNESPILRAPGLDTVDQFPDETAVPGVSYAYRVIFVNANREPLLLPSCDCSADAWSNCPVSSTPALRGAVVDDWGWALLLAPCPGGCFPYAYVSGPAVEQLRPFVGSGMTFDFYGSVACGSVEGCALDVARYEAAACGTTPARGTSWGRVKTSYR